MRVFIVILSIAAGIAIVGAQAADSIATAAAAHHAALSSI